MLKPITQLDVQLLRKHALGGMMNAEEARMNKQLLNEIAQRKRNSTSPSQRYTIDQVSESQTITYQ